MLLYSLCSLQPCNSFSHFGGYYSICSVSHIKGLGIIVSSDLSWDRIFYVMLTNLSLFSTNTLVPVLLLLKKNYIFPLQDLNYCSQSWRPSLVKHIVIFERFQRHAATGFILSCSDDNVYDYKSKLIFLNVPLNLWLEMLDILFLVNIIQFTSTYFHSIFLL